MMEIKAWWVTLAALAANALLQFPQPGSLRPLWLGVEVFLTVTVGAHHNAFSNFCQDALLTPSSAIQQWYLAEFNGRVPVVEVEAMWIAFSTGACDCLAKTPFPEPIQPSDPGPLIASYY